MAALPPLSGFRSALIVKPSSLGDIVHTLPAIHLIKEAHPALRIRWIANPEWLPLIQGAPCVDETTTFPRAHLRGWAALPRWLSWARQFRGSRSRTPEIALDFQGLLRSALICRASGADCIVGLSDAREGATLFHQHRVTVDAAAHAVERYLMLPRAFGIPVDTSSLHWPLPAGEPMAEMAHLPPFVLVHPWSRGQGKSLSSAALEALLKALAPRPVVLVGKCAEPPTQLPQHVHNLANATSLAQLIWLMRRADWNISVDSGPMHIAAAVSDRTIGIHSWSDPRKVGPFNPAALVWKAGRLASRKDFSAEECQQDTAFAAGHVTELVARLSATR
jgi:heptosyltransferase I